MSLHRAFALALVAVSVGLVSLVVATAARHVVHLWADRRRARLEAVARPALLALLDPSPGQVQPALGRAERATVARLAAGMLGKLRGGDRAALVDVLAGDGVLDEAVRRTRSRWALHRARGAELLGAAGWSPARWDLARLCSDRNAEVRSVAARALGKLGDPVAIPVLLAALEPPARLPVSTVAMSLARITDRAAPRLRVALASPTPTARLVAADLLGVHGSLGALDDLVEVLRHDADASVRAAAARALGRIGSPRAIHALVEAAARPTAEAVRAEAVDALGHIGSPRALPVLARALEDGATETSERAAAALAALGPRGRELLALRARVPGPAGRRAQAALARTYISDGAGRRRPAPARRAA